MVGAMLQLGDSFDCECYDRLQFTVAMLKSYQCNAQGSRAERGRPKFI